MSSTSTKNVDIVDTNKKAKFLDLYSRDEVRGNVSLCCQAVGISRQTYYNWLDDDEGFREMVKDAKLKLCDDMERILIDRAIEKDTTALIYWLKNRHPDFNENERKFNQTNVQVNIPILGDMKAE